MSEPNLIDYIAGFVAILAADLPDVNVSGHRLPADRSVPSVVVSVATAPSDPDLPLITARVDIKVHASEGTQAEEIEATDVAARVYASLHRRGRTEVTVGGDTYRLYRSLHINSTGAVADPETRQSFILDMYEGKWASRPV